MAEIRLMSHVLNWLIGKFTWALKISRDSHSSFHTRWWCCCQHDREERATTLQLHLDTTTMAGSTSSISSNEGRNAKPVATVGRGYNLSAPPAPAPPPPAGGSQSSRTQTPPPPSVGQQSAFNSQPSSPSAASRNALGISHGWGVGLAHSGSYLGKRLLLTLLLRSQ